MIAKRLMLMIERHSGELAVGLLERCRASEKCVGLLRNIPAQELETRAAEVYRNLADWLLEADDKAIAQRYGEIGARRAEQGVPLPHLLWAIALVKRQLWEHLNRHAMVDGVFELLQEIELLQLVDRFFDLAVYHASEGYVMAAKTGTAAGRAAVTA